jgi:hypothetical protein
MNRLLAPNYTILARSADPQNVFIGSPALAELPSGRLICTYEWFRGQPLKEKVADQCETLLSDDDGKTWQRGGRTDLMWASPFAVGDMLYLIGNLRGSRSIAICRSTDSGVSWSPPAVLFEGRYTNAPTSVTRRGDTICRAFETCPPGNGNWQSLVVAGDATRDLLDPAAWRMSNHVPYPGTPATFKQGDHPQGLYPPQKNIPEDGWLEGNVVAVGDRLRIILRVRMQGEATAGICGVCEVTDDGDQLTNRFAQFYPMPGGQCKFHIVPDPHTGLFWTTATVATDTFQRAESLWERGFKGSPGNERRVLLLLFSRDALNWFQAGFIVIAPSVMESFSYTSQLIHGADLLICARTSLGGKNQHDTNLVTLHRVQNFRDLVPEGF